MTRKKIHLYVDADNLRILTQKSFRTFSGEVNYLLEKEVKAIEEKENTKNDKVS